MKSIQNSTNTKIKGNKGEDIACEFLRREGFSLIQRNYRKVWGELDVITEKDAMIHFFEVKSVMGVFDSKQIGHRPEDNVHGLKTKHIGRMIETYLEEKGRGFEMEFCFHVLCVFMDQKTRRAQVKWMRNIIL